MESIIKPKTTTTTTVMVAVPLLTVKSSSSSMMVNQSTTTTIKPKNKSAKRKNSEKRKEKSRKAARERRSQEAKLFDCIEEILPVPTKILEHLDKASLVRIAINYLKIRSVIEPFNVNNNDTILDESIIDKITIDHSFLNTLNGFLFVLSKNGDIIYLSENVERYLGLNQIDLMGQSIYDYSHPCDHDDIKTFLQPLIDAYNATKSSSSSSSTIPSSMDSLSIKTEPLKTSSKSPSTVISSSLNNNNDQKILDNTNGPYFIRMKCTLTNKGRSLNLKSANYKVIKCHGRMINLEQINPKYANLIGENYRHYMIVIADVIQHPIRMEIPLKSDLFISKHLPNMKFSYVDENIKELFGYNVNELIGTSFYQYFDGNDCKQLSILFKTLFSKGQCDFGQYKFLVKTGGYRWITTQATIINEPNSSRPQSIILIHQVISNIENGHLLTSDLQQQQQQLTINSAIRSDNISTVCNNNNNNISLSPIAPSLNHHSVVSTTSSIIESSIKHHHHQQQQQQQTSFPCQQKSVSISIPELANIECPSLSTTIVSSSTASLVAVPALINDQQHPPLISPPLPTTSTNSSFITKTKEEKQDQESEKQQLKQKLLQQQQQLVEPICQPQSITDQFISSTEQVLAPKTADMESGFLVFTEDNNGLTVLNDADDLTHLAPDAGDLCVPMFPDMDFTDMNIFDEIFLNSSSFNISANGGVLSEDEFLNNLVSLDPNINDKLKLDSMDNIGMDFENQFMMKRFPTETTFSDLNNHHSVNNSVKDSLKSNGLDMNSNDPFLSFTNDDFLLSNSPNGSRSDCSMGESSFISSNDSSPSSSSSSSSQYSPKSISDDSMGKLCDNNNNLNDDKDLEMRAPFIPIDDDYLLNDFPCSNLDDLFDWISNTNINNNNNNNNDGNNNLTITNNNNGGNNNTKLNCFNDPFNRQQQQFSTTTNNNNNSKKSSLPKLNNGGCLEALLQNDQLIRNLKNKIYSSSNQILQQQSSTTPSLKINNNPNNDNNNSLNREQFRQQLQQRQQQILHDASNIGNDDNNLMTTFTNNENIILNNNNNNRSATPTATTTMKRKNSNIYVYTTMTQTGEKKIKNLILTPEIPAQKMIINNQNSNGNCTTTTTTTTNGNTNTASIHHFVLTKNNELIPKVAFINQQQQQQQFKVPKQLAIPNINQTAINIASITSQQSQPQTNEIIIKENVFKKPRSSESMVKNFSSNSVLLNLLVKGSDLNNGYELSYPNNNNNGSSNSSSPLSSPSSSSSSSSSSSLFNSPISIKLSSSDLIHSANSNNNNNCLLVTTTTSSNHINQNHLNHMALSSTGMVTTSGTMIKNHL